MLTDLILTSNDSKIVKVSAVELSISDYKLVYRITNVQRAKKDVQIITVKNYKGIDNGKLQEKNNCT